MQTRARHANRSVHGNLSSVENDFQHFQEIHALGRTRAYTQHTDAKERRKTLLPAAGGSEKAMNINAERATIYTSIHMFNVCILCCFVCGASFVCWPWTYEWSVDWSLLLLVHRDQRDCLCCAVGIYALVIHQYGVIFAPLLFIALHSRF